jgi:hypothetical protein
MHILVEYWLSWLDYAIVLESTQPVPRNPKKVYTFQAKNMDLDRESFRSQ